MRPFFSALVMGIFCVAASVFSDEPQNVNGFSLKEANKLIKEIQLELNNASRISSGFWLKFKSEQPARDFATKADYAAWFHVVDGTKLVRKLSEHLGRASDLIRRADSIAALQNSAELAGVKAQLSSELAKAGATLSHFRNLYSSHQDNAQIQKWKLIGNKIEPLMNITKQNLDVAEAIYVAAGGQPLLSANPDDADLSKKIETKLAQLSQVTADPLHASAQGAFDRQWDLDAWIKIEKGTAIIRNLCEQLNAVGNLIKEREQSKPVVSTQRLAELKARLLAELNRAGIQGKQYDDLILAYADNAQKQKMWGVKKAIEDKMANSIANLDAARENYLIALGQPFQIPATQPCDAQDAISKLKLEFPKHQEFFRDDAVVK